eukprot:Blabericola_migrator_1__1119@NODE_1287_length_4891_cov_200_399668_g869_i0_p1_GENE_NODE_1287_length_4891_cov_200_399668_g869_i0NODE_1287_length_4891_cov_200_399668_g869_i0_p1_ORF_typecomplete_len973_score187_41GFO_IDH_MocA/PF01408_22/2_6e08Coatomer_E/PF04733_14/6_4e05Methyltransf_28/PF02636_17/0_00019TPR_15/PF13429_6/0_00084TPR_12/PF13424_6/0_0017TPR_MalT/PF17874_1/0_003TPR_19/PF14559_6/0_006TPR_14/PF13428_6/52TPR_14/PF13428_6/0_72ANAPC3/PF12895_7/0_016NARP1/PF12569_8/4_5e03NARP1/PF12569_8/0_02Me
MAAEAWTSNQVPMFVSSNARLCRDYATLVYNYMADFYSHVKPEDRKTMYILELGAGHGRFSFLFLRMLLNNLPMMRASGFPEQPFVYVFTDIAQGNIDTCRKHYKMIPYIEQGWLDFSLFDANCPQKDLHLIVKNQPIPEGSPLVVISNYVMDSLKTDAIQVIPKRFMDPAETGVMLSLTRVSIYSDREEPNIEDPTVLGRATFGWDNEPVKVEGTILENVETDIEDGLDEKPHNFVLGSGFGTDSCKNPKCQSNCQRGCLDPESVGQLIASHIGDGQVISKMKDLMDNKSTYVDIPDWMQDPYMMKLIRRYMREALEIGGPLSTVIPIGALGVMRYFIERSNNQLMVLIGDKGYASPINLIGLRHPHIAIHGTISFGCNFNALEKFTDVHGGFHFNTKYKGSFHISSFCFSRHPSNRYVNLAQAFMARWQDLVPELLVTLMQEAEDMERSKGVSLKHMNSLIRLSCHDPDALLQFHKSMTINCQPPEMTALHEIDMLQDLRELYANWFKLKKGEDLPETLAHLCVKMGKIREAVWYFKEFVRVCPEQVSAGTLTNLAGCLNALRQCDEAEEIINECLAKHPGFPPALSAKANIAISRRLRKFAVIGTGTFASDLSHFLSKNVTCRIVAVFGFNPESVKRFKSVHQLQEAEIVTNWTKEICDNPDISCVIVDVDMALWRHFLPALWKRGKNTLCERTVGLSVPDFHQLLSVYNQENTYRADNNLPIVTWHVTNRESSDSFITSELAGPCLTDLDGLTLTTRVLTPRDVPSGPNGRSIALRRELIRAILLCCKITGALLKRIACTEVKNSDDEAQTLTGWGAFATPHFEYRMTFNITIIKGGRPGVSLVLNGSRAQVVLESATCYWKSTIRDYEKGSETTKSFMSSPIQDSIHTFISGVHSIETEAAASLNQASRELLIGLIEDLSLSAGIDKSIERRGMTVTFRKIQSPPKVQDPPIPVTTSHENQKTQVQV